MWLYQMAHFKQPINDKSIPDVYQCLHLNIHISILRVCYYFSLKSTFMKKMKTKVKDSDHKKKMMKDNNLIKDLAI